ncbi:MAG TPA: hypothetical protein PKY59_14395 [Pyrinomonadaceae bacterium]|nr:hypothetical protein [Pyrinomonadaceae bacterium]
MLNRLIIFLLILVSVTSIFAQNRRKTSITAKKAQPGYYFTINTCNACCYNWHDDAVKLFKAEGVPAVIVTGQERKNSNTAAFAPIRSFEKFFYKDVYSDSEICAQITLYVGPFDSEELAVTALEKFPAVLFSVIKNRGSEEIYSEAELQNLRQSKVVQSGTSNNWTFGNDSFFFINGYQIMSATTSKRVLANKNWQPFWSKFSNAVNAKDLRTLVQLSCSDFFYYDGTAEDWLDLKIKSSEWSSIKKAVASGTRPLEVDDRNEIERITVKYEDLIFKFENGKRWCFSQPAKGD